jgi:hypothetical protein
MKKAISWKQLVKKTADEQKKNGTFDFKKVLADAGGEWKKIKSGKHDEYVVSDVKETQTRKSKPSSSSSKKSKKNKSSNVVHEDCDADMILSKNILCKSCKSKVEKLVKKQKQSGGSKLPALSPSDYSPAAKAQAPAPAHAVKAPEQAPAPATKAPAAAEHK